MYYKTASKYCMPYILILENFHQTVDCGLWIVDPIFIGSGFNDFMDPDPA
jgi:hypothetical protein